MERSDTSVPTIPEGATPPSPMIRVGMSGFSYPEWIGDVYPAGTKRQGMLAEYAKIFPAVEINMSFRRTPEEKTIDRWREAVPETFRFTMKANQGITHYKRLVDTGADVEAFVGVCRGLHERLGPILFQLPKNVRFDAGAVDRFGTELVAGFAYAIEYRDESFNCEEADRVLRQHGIARCVNDDFFEPKTYTVTGPVAYFRFHRAGYDADELRDRAELLKEIARSGVGVYAFFQHEDDPESVRPALRFQELVG